jgi:hypothetical protein
MNHLQKEPKIIIINTCQLKTKTMLDFNIIIVMSDEQIHCHSKCIHFFKR